MTDTMATTMIEQTVGRYFDMWNEPDPARRRELIERTWAPVASYLDPMFSADGYDELEEMVAGAVLATDGRLGEVTGFITAVIPGDQPR
jgi:hypothetical protein